MQPVFYKVGNIGNAFLATMARPRSGDWIEDEFAAFARAGIHTIVSLLEPAESEELGLKDEEQQCTAAGIAFLNVPIPDRGVPADGRHLYRIAAEIYEGCSRGDNTAIHCRAGIGRSTLFAATVLMHAGIGAEEALTAIGEARGMPVPDTEDQWNWLLDYEASHHASG